VAGQLALSLLLLLGAGLLIRSLGQAARIDRGFDGSRTAVVAFDMRQANIPDGRGAEFYRRLEERTRQLPGVTRVAWAHRLPLTLNYEATSILADGEVRPADAAPWSMPVAWVSPEYFEAIGTPVLRGRAFAETDRPDAPRVAIVSTTAAARLWPGADPIGRVIRQSADGPGFEVVGVAADSKVMTLGEEPRPKVYFATTQAYRPDLHLLATVTGNPADLLPALRALVRELDPDLAFADLTTMNAQMSVALFPLRFAAGLLTVLGAAGLLIAAIGLYGVIAQGVAQRTRELGIRIALGADRGQVALLVLRDGMLVVLLGAVIGVALAMAGTRVLGAWLYGISATDPVTFLAVPAGFAAVAALACWLPARRATRVDPMVALRAE
jgi:predicted permease